MAVAGRLAIARRQQIKLADNAINAEVKMTVDQLRQLVRRQTGSPKSIDGDRNRSGKTDGPGQLDFASRRQPGGNDIFCHVARGIGRRTIDLRRIFTGKRPAAVARCAAIGIDNDFAPGQAAIRSGPTVDKRPRWINQQPGSGG